MCWKEEPPGGSPIYWTVWTLRMLDVATIVGFIAAWIYDRSCDER